MDVNNYKSVVLKDKNYWDIITNINLKRVSDTWPAIELEFISKGKKGDCPDLISSLPVFSERAISILDDLLKDSVEYLPFLCPGKVKYYGVNVLKSIDCINHDNAEVVRFDSGRIMRFKKYAFKKDMLEGIQIFKIPDLLNSPVFVGEIFVDKVKETGLEGFKFEEVG